MRLQVALQLCAIWALFLASPTSGHIHDIINGVTSKSGQWPFMAALYRISSSSISRLPDQWPFMAALHKITEDDQFERAYVFFCGAVIWDNQTILTAAHCLEGEEADQIAVYLGHVNRMNINAGYLFDVKKIIAHEEYGYWNNDIALLRLATPINFTAFYPKIAPVLRPESWQLVNPEQCMVLGWGQTGLGRSVRLLREADVSLESCYPQCHIQRSGQIKAGDIGAKRGTCYGDSGGPLLCALPAEPLSYCLVGITSYGAKSCRWGEVTRLGTFTYVPHYLDWIKQHTEKSSFAEATTEATTSVN